jgi:hypothetical protein
MNIQACLTTSYMELYTSVTCCQKAGRPWGSIPDEVIGFLNRPTPSSRNLALDSTQPLTEMSTRNLPGGKEQPARNANDLTVICEPIA